MFDVWIRKLIDPPLNVAGQLLHKVGITANQVTFMGFFFSILSFLLITQGQFTASLLFVILNRVCDGLDGAVARASKLSDFGGFLDIVFDFITYAGIPFAFSLHDPDLSFHVSLLIFSFIGTITSFLAYATIAAKRKIETSKQGKKSFYYLGGITEGGETVALLVGMHLFPQYFKPMCIVFSTLCWLTTVGRVYSAYADFA